MRSPCDTCVHSWKTRKGAPDLMFTTLFSNPRPTVVIICTANVCRSPVAAAMLRSELRAKGGKGMCKVVSAGTSVAAFAQLPDPRMRRLARRVGVSLRGERATPLDLELVEKASLIVAMEHRHLEFVRTLLEDAQNEPQLRLLGEWVKGLALENDEIADPYFSNANALAEAFEQIQRGTQNLSDDLLSGTVSLR